MGSCGQSYIGSAELLIYTNISIETH